MAVLLVLKGMTPGQQLTIPEPLAVLGRHPDCEIVLDAGAVSRQHAQILCEGGDFFLEDLKSRNGTFVNGAPIQGRQRLEENDRIKICDLLFTFHRAPPRRGAPGLKSTVEDDSALAFVLVDDPTVTNSSTVMSKLDIASSRDRLRITVNPEAKLQALLEITQNLVSTISVDRLLPKILDSLFKIFLQADRGFIVLRDADDAPLVPKAFKHRRADEDETIRISRTIVNQALTEKHAILSADAASDSRFDTSQSIADFRIRSFMCAPLVDSAGRALGVIQIDTVDQRSRFQQNDLDVLVSVASQAAFALETAQLHESALRQQALERDLELARRVQKGFLPSGPPVLEGYEFFDYYDPANVVGGDYYDYVPLPDGRLAVVLADVSGKGISAALLTAKLSAEARYHLASESTLAAALRRMNAAFCSSSWEDRFVTLILAVVEPRTHEVTLANAGHMAPLLRRASGKVDAVGEECAGLPIGIDADYEYEEFRMTLEPGETLTLFTDGFSEAMNQANDLYGIERMQEQLACDESCSGKLGSRLLDDVKRFVGGRAQSDDMCLICFGRK